MVFHMLEKYVTMVTQKRKSKKLQKKYGWREAPPSKVGAPPGWRDYEFFGFTI